MHHTIIAAVIAVFIFRIKSDQYCALLELTCVMSRSRAEDHPPTAHPDAGPARRSAALSEALLPTHQPTARFGCGESLCLEWSE